MLVPATEVSKVTLVLLLIHVPPNTDSVSVTDEPTQTALVPLMAAAADVDLNAFVTVPQELP
jgi:hypothetical protein